MLATALGLAESAPSSLEQWQTRADVAASIATILGILVAGAWAYWLYVRERTRWPRAELELVVAHRVLTEEKTLLHAKVKIHNAGRGLMKPTELRVDLYRVLPLSAANRRRLRRNGNLFDESGFEAKWPCIGRHERTWKGGASEIEPAENDEWDFDFFLSNEITTALVYVYLDNQSKRPRLGPRLRQGVMNVRRRISGNELVKADPRRLGWSLTAMYDLVDTTGTRSVDNLVGKEPTIEHHEHSQIPEDFPGKGIEEAQHEPRDKPEIEQQQVQPDPSEQEPAEDEQSEGGED